MPATTLHLVCGLPGAGKTTLARRIEQDVGAVRLCPDEWIQALGLDLWDEATRARVECLQWEIGKKMISLGVSVVVEWGTWGRSEREHLRDEAMAIGARVHLYILDPPLDILLRRVHARGLEDPPITERDLDEWSRSFQRPDAEELARYDHVDWQT